jgi:AraC family transcriptional regulator, alkane utilization regulator
VDPLSDVLTTIRLDGAVYLDAEFTAPWCVEARYGLPAISELLAGASHVIFFHYLLEGKCFARLSQGTQVEELSAGDFIVFPRENRHVLGTDLSLPVVGAGSLVADSGSELMQIRHGGGGTATQFICGYLACNPQACRPLLKSLPPMLRIPAGDEPSTSWTIDLLRVAVKETLEHRSGSRSLLSKLAELLFVQAIRRYAVTLPADQRGWIAALRDAQIGKALSLMHAAPDKAWTVEELARQVALSRSAFADRFVELLGEPPMQYLSQWRLALAAQALRGSMESVERIAERYGYQSQAAFNRAFKREFGLPPAAWRKQGSARRGQSLVASSTPPAD